MRHMSSVSDLLTDTADQEEAEELRRELEKGFLLFYFDHHLPPSPISEEQRNTIISELERDGGFDHSAIDAVLQEHQDRQLWNTIDQWNNIQGMRRQAIRRTSLPSHLTEQALRRRGALAGTETITEIDSEPSLRANGKTNQDPEAGSQGQSLLNLIFRISEEQERNESYVHRRVTCNSCGIMPIRGIRYRCANCLDYDLCELCEATQIHPKTHLFYKVRIPAPFLGHPRQPEPVQYPGKPAAPIHNLTKDAIKKLCDATGYQAPEVEAYWEQFRCVAATVWPEDSGHYNLAIDRQTFDKCFVPTTSIHPPQPNLIYDRMFSYYDQNDDGFIGFEEFIKSLASLTKKNTNEFLKRIFKAYDIDSDGFVDRKDFLQMFKAYYAATKELTQDIFADMEDDVSEDGARNIVLGSQPISSAFVGSIPRGDSSSAEGKVRDAYGDLRIRDNMGAVDELDHDVAEPDDTVAEAAEATIYGNARPKNMIGFVDFSTVYSALWPPSAVTGTDIEKALMIKLPLEEVTDPEDQIAIRRIVHARLARDHQERQYVRRLAIREKRARRTFNIDGETCNTPLEAFDTHNEWIESPTPDDAALEHSFQLVLRSDRYDGFRTSFMGGVEELRWPLISPKHMVDEVLRLLSDRWTGSAIAEDFSGYGYGSNDSKKLVKLLSDRLSEAVKELGPEAGNFEPVGSFPSSRRSRSSSKVRFQDDLETDDEHESRSVTSISSRSIPVNERWGAFEVLEPEKDVGREVLYQITEEAMNGLLDSIFRLREDLALAVLNNQRVRDRYRAEIIAAVEAPFELKRLLDQYQRRWRRDPYNTTDAERLGKDEANLFLEFLLQESANVKNQLTAEKCPRCAHAGEDKWVQLGQPCFCGYYSKGWRTEPTPKEPCPSCAKMGIEAYIGGIPGGMHCGRCRTGSKQYNQEEAWLQKILAGGQSESTVQRNHSEIATDEQPREPANQNTTSPANTEAIEDLTKSIATFIEANPPSVEQTIAQKPLDALLQEAGYAAVPSTGPSRTASPPPDPTLPQNMPNTTSSKDTTLSHIGLDSLSDLTGEQKEILDGLTSITGLRSQTVNPKGLAFLATLDDDFSRGSPAIEAKKGPTGPDTDTLKWYACLDFIKAEDEERGGAGRLNFEEWEEVMKGDKGQSLGFLGSWIEMASF